MFDTDHAPLRRGRQLIRCYLPDYSARLEWKQNRALEIAHWKKMVYRIIPAMKDYITNDLCA